MKASHDESYYSGWVTIRLALSVFVMSVVTVPLESILNSWLTAEASVNGEASRELLSELDRILNKRIKHFGSEFVQSERSSTSLQLKQGAYAEIDQGIRLNSSGGAISFWVYPLWGKDDTRSHTFLSLPWNDPKRSYLAVTLGWWEPQGKGRLYFIASNQEFVHCSTPYKLARSVWTMLTAVWKSGAEGYCKLYINGGMVASQEQSFSGTYSSAGPLYLGSDKGTTQALGRSADAVIDELVIANKFLTDKQVKEIYQIQEKDPEGANTRKWKWLNEGLAIPEQVLRSSTGEILESRVMFDEDMHWAYSKQNADKILARLKAAGFNVYIPCVWHGNGTYYPTSLALPDPKLVGVISKYDPLAYLIQKAHSMGIEVHPWFTVVRREKDIYPQFSGDGVPEGAFDVHNPKFRTFIVDMMIDLVRRYNVDGVNLDYIRSMGICNSASCQDDYQRTTGGSFLGDYYLRGVLGPARSRIEHWQDNAVKDIVSTFSVRARRIRPSIVISVAGHPKPRSAHRPLEGRDEVRWMNEGLIDLVFAMDYREIIDYDTIDAVRNELRQPEGLIVLFGNYDRLNKTAPAVPRSGILVAKFVSFSQRRWPGSGVGFYIYAQMSDEQISALRDGPFKEEALPHWGTPSDKRR